MNYTEYDRIIQDKITEFDALYKQQVMDGVIRGDGAVRVVMVNGETLNVNEYIKHRLT